MPVTMVGLVAVSLLGAEPAWESVGNKGDITIESRAVAGSGNKELRLTHVTKARTLEALCDEAYGDGKFDPTEPDLKARTVLAEGPDWRLTHEQIAPAIISPRDYVLMMRVERKDGACTVRYQATTEQAPRIPDGYVRIEKVWGSWEFSPAPGGGVRIVYVTFADPAGSVPSFLVEGGRKDASVVWMKRMVAHAKVAAEGGGPDAGR